VYREQYPVHANADTFVKVSDEREHIGILILYANRIGLMNIVAACATMFAAAVL